MTHSVESKVTGPDAPMALEHGVPLYLASDEALIHILDRYPSDLLEVNGCDFAEDVLAARERGQIDGAAILEAIKTGEVWINLHNVEHAHPGLWAEIMRSLNHLAPHIGAEQARDMTGRLILSCPGTATPYHFEASGTVLFHLRGVKRVWIYPTNETYLPQKAIEQVAMAIAGDELPYVRNYDHAAWRFDLVAGESLAWPIYAPHRVENQKGLCVTLALDYQTKQSLITAGAHRANGVLRRWGWPILSMAKTPMPVRKLLWALSLVFQRFDLIEPPITNKANAVGLDRSAPAGHEFDFPDGDRSPGMSQAAPA